MTIYETIRSRLTELRSTGKTDRELADIAGCTQQQINRMINKPVEYLETVSLKTIVRLFPDLFSSAKATANGTGAAAAINGTAIGGNNNQADKVLNDLESGVLDDEQICDKCKIRVLRLIKGKK